MIYKTISTRLFCYVLCLAGVLLPTACFSLDKSDLVSLQYPSAFDFVKNKEGEAVEYNSYKVKKDYPSMDVYSYYKKKLGEQNFEEIDIVYNGSTRWFNFVDGTLKDQPIIHQFRATWVDSDEKEMCILIIDYYSKNGKIINSSKPDNNVQHISFQKVPFVKLK